MIKNLSDTLPTTQKCFIECAFALQMASKSRNRRMLRLEASRSILVRMMTLALDQHSTHSLKVNPQQHRIVNLGRL